MKLITTSELLGKSEAELTALFTEVSSVLARTEADTPERRNALASLETIARTLGQRL